MKLKLLVPDLVAIVKDQTSPTGVITSIKIIKNNTFFILETFGNFLETDLLVSGLTVSNGSFKDNVSLSWDAVSGVDGYKIFKNNTQEIATTTNTFFQDNIQQPGKLANYSVKTFVYLDGLEYRSKPVTLSGWRKLSEPIISSIIQTSPPEILINWLSVEGATGYKIYKATAPAIDQFSLYGATSSVFFSDKNIKEGVAYNYKIKASCALGDSDFSNIQSVLIQPTTPEAPTGVTASFGEFTNFIRVNWTPVNSIFYYNIYRDTSTNRIATNILDTEFIDTTAIQGVSYTYGIGAVNSSGEGPITFSNSGWLKLNPPSNFVASDGLYTNKIRLNWNSSDGASSYKIYKGTSPTEYQTISGISYDDVGVTYGEIITYKVKAVSNLSESDFSSQDTGFIAQLPPENFPTGVSASDGIFTDKIIINWNTATSIQGISGYKIFKNNNLLGVTQNTSFIDTPPAGICFEYKVKAFNNAGDGPESAGNTGWVNILPPSSLNASKQTAIQQITLNWSTSQGANFYKIFKGTPTSLSFLARTISTETQFIDSGLPIGTTFAYAVKASCSLGDSDFSPIDIGSTGFPVSLPNPPTGVSASDGAFTNKVNITWNSVSGISGYIVFADGTQIRATTNETIDHTPSPGQLINYTVASRNSAGIGSQSQGNTGWMKLTAPSILTASNNLSDRINLSWSPVSGATGYKVYLDPDTTAQLLGVTSNFSFTDINAVYGQTRKYAVKASCTLGDSEYSPIAMGSVIQLAPETPPSGILASNGSFVDKVLVTWTPPITIMGISGYSVYKTNSLGVETVQNTTNTFLDDVSGFPGQTFEYKVSAFNLAGEGPRSIGDFGWKGIAAPSSLVASQGTFNDRIVLSWNAPQGTVNYKIYRGNPLSGLTTANSTNFIDTDAGLNPGITFQYAVTAFSDASIESTFSNIVLGFVGLEAPVGLTASNGTYSDKILLSWNKVTGAQEYRIYSGSKTNKIGTTGFTFFADTTIPQGSTKDYYVSAALPDLVYETNKTGPVEGWRNINPPSGVNASKGEFSDKVRINWNTVPLASSYKVFTGLNFDTETGITLLGTVTNNEFFDTTASVGVGYTYAIKSSFNLGDSNYSNTDTGFVEGVHSEVLQYTQGIKDNYREKVSGTFVPAPPRLTPWTGDIKYRPTNIKEVIEGLTAIFGKNSSVTMGQNMFNNYHETSYYYGIKGAPGNAVNSVVEQLIQKYDPAAWWVALDGTKGITLRGGTANRYVRHYSFNDLNSKPHPDWKSGVSDWDAANTIVWANSRNKLLYNLGQVDLLQTTYNGIYRQLVDIAIAWRFLLQHNNSVIADRTANPGLYKTELQARIFNQDILEKIKIILTELKSHYPITRPLNGVDKNITFSWTNDPVTHGGRSGGIRISSGPIGATVDFDLGLGVNVNTWSPQGWTADQGEHIYDHVGRDALTDVLYLLTGATSDRPPEGISGGQRLQDDPSWDQLIKDVRMLLTKELYSHVKQTWEKRPWYIGGPRPEYDVYTAGDLDNLGMITSNQWLEQLCCSIKTAMYLYEHAETNLEKTAIRECYNTLTEILAGFFERVLDSDPSIERAGVWPEGYQYAIVAMPEVLYLLQDMKNMGDRRLWDTVTKRGAGVSYSHWINNAWRWFHSRIMPNNLIINCGSVNNDQYSGGNIYSIAGIDLYHGAVLGSEYPERGAPGSALAESLGIYKRYWGGSFKGVNNYFYELKKYAETPGVKPYRSYYRGNYFPDDQTFTWVSDFVMPDQQSTDPNQGYDPETNKQLTLTSKPFIFGIWGKGAGRFDAKAHRDEGHLSAYMGDAVILLEAGEIRNDGSTSRQFFEKYAAGHNRMQLGEYKKPSFPRPAIITGVSFGNTGGSLFMDLTNSYNIRSLTASSGNFTLVQNGIGSPWGYEYNWADYKTSPSVFYQYQIGKVTRGISWAYEPYNKVSSTIRITDFAGISGICSGASGPTDRIYYRFLIGYTGATSGTDPGITILPISDTNNRVWNVGWTGPIGQNFIDGGYTCDYVGVTMTFTSTQPIQVSKLLVGTRSTKNSVNSSDFNQQTKSYALDIRLGLSGGAVHDETKVNLITQINSTVFRQNQAIVIPTETPQIRNYGAYTLNSITSLPVNTGCSSIFTAPTNRFPSWDIQISKLSGISLGRIMIDDFTILAARSGFTAPNTTWSC